MRQVGICFNHYNNTNNITNLQNENISEKQQLSQQHFSSLKVDTIFEQQKIFIPSSSSSSSCSTFSSSPSASPNPCCMSPPILRKEMDSQNWDEEKDDVFIRMPKLEPEVLIENNDDNVNLFFSSKNEDESLEYNNNNNHLIQSLYPTKCFNLSDISSLSTCSTSSTTSSGIWSSTADNNTFLILSNNKFPTDKKLEKEEENIKNKETIEKNKNNNLNKIKKRSYVKRKIKKEEKEEVKKEEIIIKKRRGRKRKNNILNEENLKEKQENIVQKKENVKEENICEKENKNKLEKKKKLVEKEKKKKSCCSCKMNLRRRKRIKIEDKNNQEKTNNLNNLKKGKKYQINIIKNKKREEEKKELLKNKKKLKEKLLLLNITTRRRRKRKALLLAKSKLLSLSNNKKEERKNNESGHSHRQLKINSKMVQFASSSSASPSPSHSKFIAKSSKQNNYSSLLSMSEPISFCSNWRPIDQGIYKQLPLQRDSNEENINKCLCFTSIQHLSESEVKIKLGDNVLIKSADYDEDIYVGRVLSIHYDPNEYALLLTLLWFYTGRQLPLSMRLNNSISKFDENELFASRHLDIVNADSVEGIAQVLSFSEYCRYKAQLALERLPMARRPPNWASLCPRFKQNIEEDIDDSSEFINDDESDNNASFDTVFFCRSIFSIHSKRVRSKFLQLDNRSSAEIKKPNGSNISKGVLMPC